MLSYLDPGSGAIVVQAVAGGIAGIFVVIKMFGHRIADTLFFWRTSDDAELAEDPQGETDVEDAAIKDLEPAHAAD